MESALEYDKFAMLRARQHRIQKQCYDNYIKNTKNTIKQHPKAPWTRVKVLKGSSYYPNKNKKLTDGQQICEDFNEYFSCVVSNPTDVENILFDNIELFYCPSDIICNLKVSIYVIEKTLKNLNVAKYSGSNRIPPIFWKYCAKTVNF